MYLFDGLVMCVSVCIFVCMCIYLFIDVSDFYLFFIFLLMVINVSLNVYLITCLMFVLINENDDKEDAIIFLCNRLPIINFKEYLWSHYFFMTVH